jgi:hypothetical protein
MKLVLVLLRWCTHVHNLRISSAMLYAHEFDTPLASRLCDNAGAR